MKDEETKEEKRLREEYNKYLNSHSGQAYKCFTFEEWKRRFNYRGYY